MGRRTTIIDNAQPRLLAQDSSIEQNRTRIVQPQELTAETRTPGLQGHIAQPVPRLAVYTFGTQVLELEHEQEEYGLVRRNLIDYQLLQQREPLIAQKAITPFDPSDYIIRARQRLGSDI